MGVIQCATCGFDVNDRATVCPDCGGDPQVAGSVPRRCEECGATVASNAISCPACGARISEETPAKATEPGVTLTVHRVGGRTLDSYAVYLDGKRVGGVRGHGVLKLTVAPGLHSLAVGARGERSPAVELDAQLGRDVSYDCGYSMDADDIATGILDRLLGAGGSFPVQFWVRPSGEPARKAQPEAGVTPQNSLALKSLESLKRGGVISDKEYEARKAEILKRLRP